MENIVDKIYGFYDKNKAIAITKSDGSACRGKILAPDSRIIRLVMKNGFKNTIVVSQIKNIKESERAICVY